LYTAALKAAASRLGKFVFENLSIGPVVEIHKSEKETMMLIVYRNNTTHSFFSGITDLYHSAGWSSTKKFVDIFSNGFTGYRIYFSKKDISEQDIKR
jgi:hypothetical protein